MKASKCLVSPTASSHWKLLDAANRRRQKRLVQGAPRWVWCIGLPVVDDDDIDLVEREYCRPSKEIIGYGRWDPLVHWSVDDHLANLHLGDWSHRPLPRWVSDFPPLLHVCNRVDSESLFGSGHENFGIACNSTRYSYAWHNQMSTVCSLDTVVAITCHAHTPIHQTKDR
ncbi:hypothetical protein BCR44DRAFT_1442220 [Catenaria anguillulae PL171]|uniref:Uncharacterized protein n=1 Tax=Catenaria anguillulae PL171 TaxID=765915 RepID=A0A1Y2HAB8_9FUNG|nr:hypothetical protein BCR44DRAFT_1442220 [Catenaria anguillulae PL171]